MQELQREQRIKDLMDELSPKSRADMWELRKKERREGKEREQRRTHDVREDRTIIEERVNRAVFQEQFYNDGKRREDEEADAMQAMLGSKLKKNLERGEPSGKKYPLLKGESYPSKESLEAARTEEEEEEGE
jgi:hypothetical protein